MAGLLRMEIAIKNFEKSGKISRLTKDNSYRVTITRQPEQQAVGQYLFQVFRQPRKDAPKSEQVETEELNLRFDSLQRVLAVANQALAGGLDTMLMFNKPPSAES
jgi:hypothetical protein